MPRLASNASAVTARTRRTCALTTRRCALRATAIACNLGITGTTGGGYLAVNPGGNTTVTASTINWSADGQTLANGIIATINPTTREVTVICGPGGSTHFFLDVTGYWR